AEDPDEADGLQDAFGGFDEDMAECLGHEGVVSGYCPAEEEGQWSVEVTMSEEQAGLAFEWNPVLLQGPSADQGAGAAEGSVSVVRGDEEGQATDVCVGDAVAVEDGDSWYVGRVAVVNADGTFHINAVDGQREERVAKARVLAVKGLQDAAPAAAAPPSRPAPPLEPLAEGMIVRMLDDEAEAMRLHRSEWDDGMRSCLGELGCVVALRRHGPRSATGDARAAVMCPATPRSEPRWWNARCLRPEPTQGLHCDLHEHPLMWWSSLRSPHTCDAPGCGRRRLWEAFRCPKCDFDVCARCAAPYMKWGGSDMVRHRCHLHPMAAVFLPGGVRRADGAEQFSAGDRVEACFSNGRYYRATVIQVCEDGSYTVDWEDKDRRDRVKRGSEMRRPQGGQAASRDAAPGQWGACAGELMPGGCRGTPAVSSGARCPRTRLLVCDGCLADPQFGEATPETRRADVAGLPSSAPRILAALRAHPSEIFALEEAGLFDRVASRLDAPAARGLALELGAWLGSCVGWAGRRASAEELLAAGPALVDTGCGRWAETHVVARCGAAPGGAAAKGAESQEAAAGDRPAAAPADATPSVCVLAWAGAEAGPPVRRLPLSRVRPALGATTHGGHGLAAAAPRPAQGSLLKELRRGPDSDEGAVRRLLDERGDLLRAEGDPEAPLAVALKAQCSQRVLEALLLAHAPAYPPSEEAAERRPVEAASAAPAAGAGDAAGDSASPAEGGGEGDASAAAKAAATAQPPTADEHDPLRRLMEASPRLAMLLAERSPALASLALEAALAAAQAMEEALRAALAECASLGVPPPPEVWPRGCVLPFGGYYAANFRDTSFTLQPLLAKFPPRVTARPASLSPFASYYESHFKDGGADAAEAVLRRFAAGEAAAAAEAPAARGAPGAAPPAPAEGDEAASAESLAGGEPKEAASPAPAAEEGRGGAAGDALASRLALVEDRRHPARAGPLAAEGAPRARPAVPGSAPRKSGRRGAQLVASLGVLMSVAVLPCLPPVLAVGLAEKRKAFAESEARRKEQEERDRRAAEKRARAARAAAADARARLMAAQGCAQAARRMLEPRPTGELEPLVRRFGERLLAPLLGGEGGSCALELGGRHGGWLGSLLSAGCAVDEAHVDRLAAAVSARIAEGSGLERREALAFAEALLGGPPPSDGDGGAEPARHVELLATALRRHGLVAQLERFAVPGAVACPAASPGHRQAPGGACLRELKVAAQRLLSCLLAASTPSGRSLAEAERPAVAAVAALPDPSALEALTALVREGKCTPFELGTLGAPQKLLALLDQPSVWPWGPTAPPPIPPASAEVLVPALQWLLGLCETLPVAAAAGEGTGLVDCLVRPLDLLLESSSSEDRSLLVEPLLTLKDLERFVLQTTPVDDEEYLAWCRSVVGRRILERPTGGVAEWRTATVTAFAVESRLPVHTVQYREAADEVKLLLHLRDCSLLPCAEQEPPATSLAAGLCPATEEAVPARDADAAGEAAEGAGAESAPADGGPAEPEEAQTASRDELVHKLMLNMAEVEAQIIPFEIVWLEMLDSGEQLRQLSSGGSWASLGWQSGDDLREALQCGLEARGRGPVARGLSRPQAEALQARMGELAEALSIVVDRADVPAGRAARPAPPRPPQRRRLESRAVCRRVQVEREGAAVAGVAVWEHETGALDVVDPEGRFLPRVPPERAAQASRRAGRPPGSSLPLDLSVLGLTAGTPGGGGATGSSAAQWQFEGDRGWTRYEREAERRIEEAHQRGDETVTVTVGPSRYEVNLQASIQRVLTHPGHRERRVQRVLRPAGDGGAQDRAQRLALERSFSAVDRTEHRLTDPYPSLRGLGLKFTSLDREVGCSAVPFGFRGDIPNWGAEIVGIGMGMGMGIGVG
ncbi:unnamed protein product, partial [Prorocentrum cordatum]